MTQKTFQVLAKEYGERKARRALKFWHEQSEAFRRGIKPLPYLRANEYLWNDPKYDQKVNPHKSFSSLNAKRARAEAALLSKANKHYARAAQLEKQGKPLQARTEATKGRQLAQRAHKVGQYTDGPVGRLPNSSYMSVRQSQLKKRLADAQKALSVLRRQYPGKPEMYRDQVAYVANLKEALKQPRKNPKRADLNWEEAERLGILKRAGVKKPETQTQPRMFAVTWYSSLKNKRVGFIRPIAADTKSEAITIAKSMIDNDPKAKAFLAREIKRNGIVDIAAGMQALDYLGRTVKGKRNPGDVHIDAGHVTIVGKTKRIKTQNPRLIKGSKIVKARESDGAIFPVYNGELLSWSIGSYITLNEERAGFPRAKRVIQAMRKYRPEQLERERKEMLKGSFDRLFGHNAKKVLKLIERKRNPSVTTLSKTFQGKANGAIDEYYASDAAPKNLARAGKLVFLKVAGRSLRLPGAMVAIAPNNKLWITGKQALFATKAKSGEGLDMGEVSQICYETAKAHIEDGKRVEYVHEFGEDGGRRPHLIIDHEGMPILRGGDYQIKAEGIVN